MTDLTDSSVDASNELDTDGTQNDALTGVVDPRTPHDQRPATRADELRTAVASQILELMSNPDNSLPLRTVSETAGRSILLDFDDDSRLIVQIAAIPSANEVDVELASDSSE